MLSYVLRDLYMNLISFCNTSCKKKFMIREVCNFPSQLVNGRARLWTWVLLIPWLALLTSTPNCLLKFPVSRGSECEEESRFHSYSPVNMFLLYVCFRSSSSVKVYWAVTTMISFRNFFWKTLFSFCLWVWLATSVLKSSKYVTGYL